MDGRSALSVSWRSFRDCSSSELKSELVDMCVVVSAEAMEGVDVVDCCFLF